MLTDWGSAALGIVSGILAARLLGPRGEGELAAIQTWPSFMASVAMFGIPSALVYYSAREPKVAGQWLSTAMVVCLATCVPFAIAGYLVMPWLLSSQSPAIIAGARAYLWLLPLFALVGSLQHPLRGRNDLLAWNVLRPLPTVMWIVILVASWAVRAAYPIPLSQAYLVGMALLFIPMGLVVLKRIPGSFRPSKSRVVPLLIYGLPVVMSTVPSTLNLRLDQMLMVGLMAPNILGLYVIGVAWSGAVALVLSALSSTLLPRVAGADTIAEQSERLAQALRLGSLGAALAAGLVGIATPLTIPLLFGSAFRSAIPAGIVLTVAAGFLAQKDLLTAGALSLGRPRYALLAETIGLAVTITFLWLLLRPFQLLGAAFASLGAYAVVFLVLLKLVSKSAGLRVRDMLFPTVGDIKLVGDRLRAFFVSVEPK